MYKEVFPALPKTLFLKKANALVKKDLVKATRHFEKIPIIVTHEGLLRYLNFNEKTKVAKNIHSPLEEFGGVWITCDITLAKMLPKSTLKKIKDRIGLDVSKNAFRNVTCAKKFFKQLGFEIKVHSLKEIQNELVTPKVFKLTKNQTKRMLDFYVFEMRVKE
jgi:hypothetical protein